MDQNLNRLKNYSSFDKETLFEIIRSDRKAASDITLYRIVDRLINDGEIIRTGRDSYCLPKAGQSYYHHYYRERSNDIAAFIKERHPDIDFRIFETVQLNDFLNHLIGLNVIFLLVEDDLGSFLFDDLRTRFDNNVLLYPSRDIYFRYWKEDMIVIEKLITEAPRGRQEFWHTDLEKFLVDIMTDGLIMDSFSPSEYPLIYETSFKNYVIDERRMFRYARRRNAEKKLKEYLSNNTAVRLETT